MIPNQVVQDILEVATTGVALSCIWYWAFVFYHHDATAAARNWWLRNICPQGILISIALKYLNII
jgi:hypothetical protein